MHRETFYPLYIALIVYNKNVHDFCTLQKKTLICITNINIDDS